MINFFTELFNKDTLTRMSQWIESCLSNHPNKGSAQAAKNKQVQYGCFIEEVVEVLESVTYNEGAIQDSTVAIKRLKSLSDKLKNDDRWLVNFPKMNQVESRVALLKELTDVVQTACSVAYTNRLKLPEASRRTTDSQYSKFKNGKPLFHPNGKVMKNPDTYKEPFLDDLV